MVGAKKSWELLFSKRAQKESLRLKKSHLKEKASALLDILEQDPFQDPPPFKSLLGTLSGYYARRINIQHRLVYAVSPETKKVRIYSMWHHYDN